MQPPSRPPDPGSPLSLRLWIRPTGWAIPPSSEAGWSAWAGPSSLRPFPFPSPPPRGWGWGLRGFGVWGEIGLSKPVLVNLRVSGLDV